MKAVRLPFAQKIPISGAVLIKFSYPSNEMRRIHQSEKNKLTSALPHGSSKRVIADVRFPAAKPEEFEVALKGLGSMIVGALSNAAK